MKRKLRVILTIICLLAPLKIEAMSKEIKVFHNNNEIHFQDQGPLIINNRTLVPIRGVAESLELKVNWNESKQKVSLSKEGLELELFIGNKVVNKLTKELSTTVELEEPPIIRNGRVLIPLRAVSEMVGAEVNWDNAKRIIDIKSNSNVEITEPKVVKRINEIKDMWKKLKPKSTQVQYKINPKLNSPYEMGELSNQALNDALNMTNFIRFVAHLEGSVSLDEEYNKEAQASSIVNNTNKKLTHYPTKPYDMNNDIYLLGKKGSKTSNISMGRSNIIDSIVYGYMEDGGPSNIMTVGHRRWVLSPKLNKVGFGYAGIYSAQKVIEDGMFKNPHPAYDYISYPSRIAMPIEHFGPTYPWSVSLDDDRYDADKLEDIEVKLIRERDGKKWSFSKTNSSSGFFNIDTDNYGYLPFTIIFRPIDIKEYKHGDKFILNIENVYTLEGYKANVTFETTFFKLEN